MTQSIPSRVVDFLTDPNLGHMSNKYYFWLLIGMWLAIIATSLPITSPVLGLGGLMISAVYLFSTTSGLGLGIFFTAMREIMYHDGGWVPTLKAAVGLAWASPLLVLFGALTALGIATTTATIGITAGIAAASGVITPWLMYGVFGSKPSVDPMHTEIKLSPIAAAPDAKAEQSTINHLQLYNDIMHDDVATLQSYLDQGIPVDTKIKLGMGDSPLIVLAVSAHEAKEKIDLLIAREANVDATNAQGYTALHMAAESGKVEIAQALINAGATKGIKADDGKTPWNLANENYKMKLLTLLPKPEPEPSADDPGHVASVAQV